jgi:hypothetical protein
MEQREPAQFERVIQEGRAMFSASSVIDTSAILPALEAAGLRPGDTVGVFASGSMVRGWGNPTSDVDIHVISQGIRRTSVSESTHVALSPTTLGYERIFVGGRRWDIEYWTADQVEQLLVKVSWEAYESPDSPWSTLSRAELGMLERLPFALAADDGEWLRKVQNRIGASAHRCVLVGILLRESDGLIEDAAGQLEASDLKSAVIATKLAFSYCVDALQASEGQFGSLWPKWRARRMTLIDSPALSIEDYWKIETMADYDDGDPRAWVERVVRMCRLIARQLEGDT